MKHMVALSGSYGGNADKLFKSLKHDGILQLSLVGREITLQVKSENLDDVKESLRRLGVGNVSILEWKKIGVTLSGSGTGTDPNETVQVSLIPSALDEGLRTLAVLCDLPIEHRTIEEIESKINSLLSDAGVTDALYAVHIKKKTPLKECLKAAEVATLNALFESGGVVSIE